VLAVAACLVLYGADRFLFLWPQIFPFGKAVSLVSLLSRWLILVPGNRQIVPCATALYFVLTSRSCVLSITMRWSIFPLCFSTRATHFDSKVLQCGAPGPLQSSRGSFFYTSSPLNRRSAVPCLPPPRGEGLSWLSPTILFRQSLVIISAILFTCDF